MSRVLNGVGPMKDGTKQRVLHAAEELGYYPMPSRRASPVNAAAISE